jgi:CelD/BcsL family acetyltransferase involved in cellulose biosynthesis
MLRPELFQIVGRFNPGTFVAVIEEPSRPAVFFPFHRPTRLDSFAGPVPICDYQAFITPMSNNISVRDALRAAGLRTWSFENLIAPNEVAVQTTTTITQPSWCARLHTGFATYAEDLQRTHSSFKNITRNLKVIARDHGDMRFVCDCADPAVLTRIFSWKAERFNGGDEVSRWIVEAVDALRTTRTRQFGGVLSALYVGDRLAAAHFGIRSGRTLFYWFPAFNPEFGKYTPGHLLVTLLLQHLQELGCDVLDFGPGGEKYKVYFANTEILVRRGFVELPSLLNFGRGAWRSIHGTLRKSQVARSLARPVMRMIR